MKLNSNVKLLALFNFFYNFRLYSVVSILFFSQVAGSFILGMSVFSVLKLSSALFEVPTGVLSDYVGRRKTMIIGAIAGSIGVVIYAFSFNFLTLAVGSVFQGFASALFSGNNESLLHDSLKESGSHHYYSKWLGKVTSLSQVGAGIAAVIGSILASFSYRYMMIASIFPISMTIIVAFLVKEPKVNYKVDSNIFSHLFEALGYFKKNSKLRLLSIVKVWYFSFDEVGYHFQSAFTATVWPVWAIGFLKIISKVIGAISFDSSGKIIKKFGDKNIIMFRSVWDHISRFIALIFPGVFSPILMSSNQSLWAIGSISEKALLQKEFTDHQRSTMGSLTALVENVGYALIGALLGFMADLYGPVMALIILQVGKIPLLYFVKKFFSQID